MSEEDDKTKDFSRNVEVYCPVCGGKQFEHESYDVGELLDDYLFKCISCQRQFTKDVLLEANAELISLNIEEIVEEVTCDLAEQIRKAFR